MAGIGAKRPALAETQKAKRVRPGAPLLETRARPILATMVHEAVTESMRPELPEELTAEAEKTRR
jgi:hypothetical protein